jgi:ribosomal protein L11 methyltransferase
MPIIRVDIQADKGTEELLPAGFYDLCSGVWIEENGDTVTIRCYPREVQALAGYVAACKLPVIAIDTVEEEEKDYAALVRQYFTPVRIGSVTVLPPWRTTSRKGPVITIEPGMAFGTGRHESTKLMVGMMGGIDMKGKSVLDIGAGSGILALYARLLGASRVAAIDHDPLAAEAMQTNMALNPGLDILVACADLGSIAGTFDVVLANLDFDTFRVHAQAVVDRVAPGGSLIVSGIEQQYAKDLPALFRPFTVARHRRMKDWHAYLFRVDTEPRNK